LKAERTIHALDRLCSDPVEAVMKRSINFGSIFRRKEDQEPQSSSDQTDQAALLERFTGRSIKLAAADLRPAAPNSPPLEWDRVDGAITIPAIAIEGMLEGRARIRAAHLKSLSPSPLGADTPDQSEYAVSLPALIPQIQDLLGESQPEIGAEPEYETPFTIIAKQDGARFAEQSKPQKKEEPPQQLKKSDLVPLFHDVAGTPGEPRTAKGPEHEEEEDIKEEPAGDSLHVEPLVLTLRTLRPEVQRPGDHTQPPESLSDREDTGTNHDEMKRDETQTQEPTNLASDKIKVFEMETKEEEPLTGEGGVGPRLESRGWGSDTSPAGRGLGLLQEIFMTSEPLDGRRVASLVRQFPGVTGALILLEGGAVLGGQLPTSLNMEAALQAPAVLGAFLRFILELEGGSVLPRFVTVTSTNTISLVTSGQVVLLASHQGRKLPPGLAQRLTETAQALDLIYGKTN
jgi:hypothetical protein